MTDLRRRTPVLLSVALLGVGVALAVLAHTSHAAPSLGALNSQLAAQQARQQQLSHSIGGLSGQVSSLQNQIAIVRQREADVRAQLARDQAALAAVKARLAIVRARVRRLRAQLAWARKLLARQLLSSYEGGQPDLVSVVLDSGGFAQLLDKVTFLGDAETAQQRIIAITKTAKTQADAAAARLATLKRSDQQLVDASAVQARALAGMNQLLGSKEAALAHALAAQEASLQASRARGGAIQSEINTIRAQQAAAAAAAAAQQRQRQAAAAAAAATPAPTSAPVASGPALGPSGGWSIPYAIVLCESGGQDLPPNSAGASGYYQIMPATWKLFGGSGPAAYLAPKSEQDAVASRIWAGIVGIH
jgi:septal ring factor EnvC (AmiA/AmiB activator)